MVCSVRASVSFSYSRRPPLNGPYVASGSTPDCRASRIKKREGLVSLSTTPSSTCRARVQTIATAGDLRDASSHTFSDAAIRFRDVGRRVVRGLAVLKLHVGGPKAVAVRVLHNSQVQIGSPLLRWKSLKIKEIRCAEARRGPVYPLVALFAAASAPQEVMREAPAPVEPTLSSHWTLAGSTEGRSESDIPTIAGNSGDTQESSDGWVAIKTVPMVRLRHSGSLRQCPRKLPAS